MCASNFLDEFLLHLTIKSSITVLKTSGVESDTEHDVKYVTSEQIKILRNFFNLQFKMKNYGIVNWTNLFLLDFILTLTLPFLSNYSFNVTIILFPDYKAHFIIRQIHYIHNNLGKNTLASLWCDSTLSPEQQFVSDVSPQ